MELVVDGEKLNDLQMYVSESFLDSAKVQALFKTRKQVEAQRMTQHDLRLTHCVYDETIDSKVAISVLIFGYVWSCFAKYPDSLIILFVRGCMAHSL